MFDARYDPYGLASCAAALSAGAVACSFSLPRWYSAIIFVVCSGVGLILALSGLLAPRFTRSQPLFSWIGIAVNAIVFAPIALSFLEIIHRLLFENSWLIW